MKDFLKKVYLDNKKHVTAALVLAFGAVCWFLGLVIGRNNKEDK